jgi:predicted  nucleic acid-binding Zn-ribbon protein
MANFQVIFSGNEDELYKFVITWKMLTDLKKYEEMKKEIEYLEDRIKEMREELSKLDDIRRSLQREITELTAKREALKREIAAQQTTDIKLNI